MISFDGLSAALLAEGVAVRMRGRGMSMFPLIGTGDGVVVQPGKRFAPGDIVVFSDQGTLVCHRLIKIFERNGVGHGLTRGDARLDADEPVPLDRIVGKVVMIESARRSIPRSVMVLLRPALRFGRLNAYFVAVALGLRCVAKAPHLP